MLLILVRISFCFNFFSYFFFNDTATTEIYTLSLHDALPISEARPHPVRQVRRGHRARRRSVRPRLPRSEEHTSELQSHLNLVCRLPLQTKITQTRPPAPGSEHGNARRGPSC